MREKHGGDGDVCCRETDHALWLTMSKPCYCLADYIGASSFPVMSVFAQQDWSTFCYLSCLMPRRPRHREGGACVTLSLKVRTMDALQEPCIEIGKLDKLPV